MTIEELSKNYKKDIKELNKHRDAYSLTKKQIDLINEKISKNEMVLKGLKLNQIREIKQSEVYTNTVEKWKKELQQLIKVEDENYLKIMLYLNNIDYLYYHLLIDDIKAVLYLYQTKPLGEKTRSKLENSIHGKLVYDVPLINNIGKHHFKVTCYKKYEKLIIRIELKNNHNISMYESFTVGLIENKINPESLKQLHNNDYKKYIDNVETFLKNKLKLDNEIKKKENELCALKKQYNDLTDHIELYNLGKYTSPYYY